MLNSIHHNLTQSRYLAGKQDLYFFIERGSIFKNNVSISYGYDSDL